MVDGVETLRKGLAGHVGDLFLRSGGVFLAWGVSPERYPKRYHWIHVVFLRMNTMVLGTFSERQIDRSLGFSLNCVRDQGRMTRR